MLRATNMSRSRRDAQLWVGECLNVSERRSEFSRRSAARHTMVAQSPALLGTRIWLASHSGRMSEPEAMWCQTDWMMRAWMHWRRIE